MSTNEDASTVPTNLTFVGEGICLSHTLLRTVQDFRIHMVATPLTHCEVLWQVVMMIAKEAPQSCKQLSKLGWQEVQAAYQRGEGSCAELAEQF
ncbi:hypothetical protein N8612_03225, partial [Verrucomicrobia bacterium]|nr:hypothetical protein [Verrucomicrobiota bacterium]